MLTICSRFRNAVSTVVVAAILSLSVGCTSRVAIRSVPSGATVYVDGIKVGKTPVTYADNAIVGASRSVRLTYPGYEDYDGFFSRNGDVNVGAIVGGLFFLFPFLWTLDYPKVQTYELEPVQ